MPEIADIKCHVLEAAIAEPFWWSFNRSDARRVFPELYRHKLAG